MYTHTHNVYICICIRAETSTDAGIYIHVHYSVLMYMYIQLSKSDDLRVLIARKKGERSAPPTYVTGRRYSHSGSEGETEEGEGGRRGGLSSVVKVPER